MNGKARPKPSRAGRRKPRSTMTNPLATRFSSNHMVVPPAFRTKIGTCYAGTLVAASAARQTFLVSGNGLCHPFNSYLTGNSFSTTYGYYGANPITISPEGFSALCGASEVYQRYRVLSSTIIVQFAPLAQSDVLFVCTGSATSGTADNTVLWTAAESPHASKVIMFSASTPNTRLSNHLTTADIYGVPESTIKVNDNLGSYYNTTPVSEWAHVINYQTASNLVTSAIIGFAIRVEYDVEFYTPLTGALPENLGKCDETDESIMRKIDEKISKMQHDLSVEKTGQSSSSSSSSSSTRNNK
jgi:hypothetical protein